MKYLKDDIDFLEQILEKVESRNMHDQLEGYGMLRDQISNMQKRHLTPAAPKCSGQAGQETLNRLWHCAECGTGYFKKADAIDCCSD
jgi:hypothetical protein